MCVPIDRHRTIDVAEWPIGRASLDAVPPES
jgi:hypothetical protein